MILKFRDINMPENLIEEISGMKNRPQANEPFGKRIATIRKAKGLTQLELAAKIGASRRVIAYYECQSSHVPANLLLPIAKALKISVDALVGLKKEEIKSTDHAALWRRLKKAEQLPRKDQKAVCHYIEALLSKRSN